MIVKGKVITNTLLGSFRPFFPHVLALTRDTSSSTSRQLASEGAELVAAPGADLGGSDSLAEKLKGVDIVVNALGATDGTPDKALSSAAAKAGVMVYFPTEFGVCVFPSSFSMFPQKSLSSNLCASHDDHVACGCTQL